MNEDTVANSDFLNKAELRMELYSILKSYTLLMLKVYHGPYIQNGKGCLRAHVSEASCTNEPSVHTDIANKCQQMVLLRYLLVSKASEPQASFSNILQTDECLCIKQSNSKAFTQARRGWDGSFSLWDKNRRISLDNSTVLHSYIKARRSSWYVKNQCQSKPSGGYTKFICSYEMRLGLKRQEENSDSAWTTEPRKPRISGEFK